MRGDEVEAGIERLHDRSHSESTNDYQTRSTAVTARAHVLLSREFEIDGHFDDSVITTVSKIDACAQLLEGDGVRHKS